MQPGQFAVGQLYKGFTRNGLPVWSQPGGIGTPVFPALPTQFPTIYQGYYQSVMSYPSLYVFGCLHPLNCAEIFEVYDPYNDVQVALVCCPMCSYIQEIISPYETYQNYEDTPILVA
jgi:hypothetical protein